MEHLILFLIALAGVILALIGIIFPGFPGIPILWILVAVDYWFLGYLELPGLTMVWLTVLAVFSQVINYLATALGVKKRGGSLAGSIGSVIGLIIGVAVFQIPGLLIGCFVGALVGELLNGKEFEKAATIALGALLGYATATILNLATLVVYAAVIFYYIFT